MSLQILMQSPKTDLFDIKNRFFSSRNGVSNVKLIDEEQRLEATLGEIPVKWINLDAKDGSSVGYTYSDSKLLPTEEVTFYLMSPSIPRAYMPIAAASIAFLLGGIVLSSLMAILAGVGLLATIGAAIWELKM